MANGLVVFTPLFMGLTPSAVGDWSYRHFKRNTPPATQLLVTSTFLFLRPSVSASRRLCDRPKHCKKRGNALALAPGMPRHSHQHMSALCLHRLCIQVRGGLQGPEVSRPASSKWGHTHRHQRPQKHRDLMCWFEGPR